MTMADSWLPRPFYRLEISDSVIDGHGLSGRLP